MSWVRFVCSWLTTQYYFLHVDKICSSLQFLKRYVSRRKQNNFSCLSETSLYRSFQRKYLIPTLILSKKGEQLKIENFQAGVASDTNKVLTLICWIRRSNENNDPGCVDFLVNLSVFSWLTRHWFTRVLEKFALLTYIVYNSQYLLYLWRY